MQTHLPFCSLRDPKKRLLERLLAEEKTLDLAIMAKSSVFLCSRSHLTVINESWDVNSACILMGLLMGGFYYAFSLTTTRCG